MKKINKLGILCLIDPEDQITEQMNSIKGGYDSVVSIDCKSGRIKCKGDGNITFEKDELNASFSIF